jgi:glutathione synthase/RimK-type ligase-like ATP-grasp enzyme
VSPPSLLVLCDIDAAEPLRRCRGQSRFLGEVGLRLGRRGIRMICAEPASPFGYRPVPGGWREEPVEGVVAVLDRHRTPHPAVLAGWIDRGVPVANPPPFRDLCDDKLAFAGWALDQGLPVPETVGGDDPRWRDWDRPYVKPRAGWGGRGVRRHGGETVAAEEVVQRAVEPALAGESLRILLQRDGAGGWLSAGAMVRIAPAGRPVASLSRGARVRSLEPREQGALPALLEPIIIAIGRAPGGGAAVEVGVDLILAADGPWILEWNARPGRSFERIGRADLRAAAQIRPFETLLSAR